MAGDADGSLTFVLDHNLGRNVLAVLRMARASPEGRITSLDDLGIPGDTSDEAWLTVLASRAN